MPLPTSTYRLQFRNGMTFDGAIHILPYLKKLGISHLYASPIFTATAGSTHGYDVTNHNELDPSLGGREGFDRLSAALKDAGLGLIIDIVPNHMAASLENPWWASVVALGKDSPYANHFDVDWSRRLTLPSLGQPFENALAAGEIGLGEDEHGKPVLTYFENKLPLHPHTYAMAKPGADLRALHEAQPWELIFWKEARNSLSYRRFFEVTGLVGVRVEDPNVFDDVHRLTLELVKNGQVDGLRLDHIDGVADPKATMDRLRAAVGPDTYLVVEKILGEGEDVRADWPVSGTTGYEFITALSRVLVDETKADLLTDSYSRNLVQPEEFEAERHDAKLLMLTRNFAGELNRLVNLVGKIADGLTPDTVRAAIVETIIAFPVYRTYVADHGADDADKALLKRILGDVGSRIDPAMLNVLTRLLMGEEKSRDAAQFRTRFQQLSGPIMAKALEDTLFYRSNRLLALNEVGGEPDLRGGCVADFHTAMQQRLANQPHALTATSTHDTKRGEDARARLYALSEAPELWAVAVDRWRSLNEHNVQVLTDGAAPERPVEWMLYQALAGVWPVALDWHDAKALKALCERFTAYVEKALREAKRRTDWGEENAEYESAVKAYAERLLSSDNHAFLADFSETLQPFIWAGLLNSLSQTALKIMAPGIPDIYQGAEALDFSLVDPDNRRTVPFDRLAAMLDSEMTMPPKGILLGKGALKQRVVAKGLKLRGESPDIFDRGDYIALVVTGTRRDHIVAFARVYEGKRVIVAVPRLTLGLLQNEQTLGGDQFWGDTAISLPVGEGELRNIMTGEEMDGTAELRVSDLLKACPVAILTS
ncbi:malto-oligosyltrehalose synthase [Rhizobium sp. CFBP 8762]|uniref:malto-oligosyltrehalose synthase n=1 Tax=Rhizobium sp. CFBP 8762 TaxID=2775279 RepID=UPI0017818EA1|nr:malto-oligosyltrehalose synthase [Rhizobium sp. CFBP 8762]MBD8554017.1 malto-oligosyltrehalose synthase [Rhizobium sp. CFBP 8762]